MAIGGDGDAQLPLRGVVLCFTSIEPDNRTQLAAWASEMGAEHKLDLTSDVTHLIVGETQTPKYKYVAKERTDVKCLDDEWIPAVRRTWMEGIDVPLQQLEQEYKLKTFHELRICITGFEDPDQRKELESQITSHGGEYRGDLRKDCTHLVCFLPSGAKYTSAKAWGNISTVSVEWLSFSIERGLVLDEQYFDPLLPPEERGKGAWKKTERKSPSRKRTRTDETNAGGPRKLRRAASSRFSTDSVWADIVPRSGPDESHSTKSPLERTVSAPLSKVESGQTILRAGDKLSPAKGQHAEVCRTRAAVSKPGTKQGFFSGKKFFLRGFDPRRITLLKQHLESQDGEVQAGSPTSSQPSTCNSVDSSFVVVPHSSASDDVSYDASSPVTSFVTELWVEKCLHKKTFIDPHSAPAHMPFKHPIIGFEALSITSSGFEGVDLMHLGKVIRLLGATYSDGLAKTTSLLLCDDESVTKQKFRHALGWEIPAIKAAWLWDCLSAKQLIPWDDYLIHPNLQRIRPVNNASVNVGRPGQQLQLRRPKQFLGRSLSLGNKLSDVINPTVSPGPSGGNCHGRAVPHGVHGQLQQRERNAIRRTCDRAAIGAFDELSPNVISPREGHDAGQRTSKGNEDQSLYSSLHSLLVRSRGQDSESAPEILQETSHKKRRILGRARSDLSMRSAQSRAESLDSMNTDGVGTPIEVISHDLPQEDLVGDDVCWDDALSLSTDLLLSHEGLQKPASEAEDIQPLAMTQIGYDDSDATLMRAHIATKLPGLGVGADLALKHNDGIALRKAVLRDAGDTHVSHRTRLNTK